MSYILCGNVFLEGVRPISFSPTHTRWNSTRWALINKRIKLCRWLNGGFSRTNTRCLSNGVPSCAGGSGLMQSQRLDTDLTRVFIQTQLLGNIYYRPVVPGPLHLLWTMPRSLPLSLFLWRQNENNNYIFVFISPHAVLIHECQISGGVIFFVDDINNSSSFCRLFVLKWSLLSLEVTSCGRGLQRQYTDGGT